MAAPQTVSEALIEANQHVTYHMANVACIAFERGREVGRKVVLEESLLLVV
jgi:hypothetical protein